MDDSRITVKWSKPVVTAVVPDPQTVRSVRIRAESGQTFISVCTPTAVDTIAVSDRALPAVVEALQAVRDKVAKAQALADQVQFIYSEKETE